MYCIRNCGRLIVFILNKRWTFNSKMRIHVIIQTISEVLILVYSLKFEPFIEIFLDRLQNTVSWSILRFPSFNFICKRMGFRGQRKKRQEGSTSPLKLIHKAFAKRVKEKVENQPVLILISVKIILKVFVKCYKQYKLNF